MNKIAFVGFLMLTLPCDYDKVLPLNKRWSLSSQVLNENARKPLSIGYLAFSLCSDILAALSVF